MVPFNAKVSILVNLNEVVKYHKSTQMTIDALRKGNLPTDAYLSEFRVCVLAVPETIITELHPAYTYFDLAKEAGLTKNQTNNLIYITYAFCKFEWGYYSNFILNIDQSKDISLPNNTEDKPENLNLLTLAKEELSQLLLLLDLLDSGLDNINITISHKGKEPISQKAKGHRNSYNQRTATIKTPEIVKATLKAAIDSSFSQMRNSANNKLTELLAKMVSPSYQAIKDIIDGIELFPNHNTSISHFRKLVTKTSLSYLNNETTLTSPPREVNPGQAQIIYSLLALFKLIDFDLIEGHVDRVSRTNYIRSLLFNTGNNKSTSNTKEGQDNPFNNVVLLDHRIEPKRTDKQQYNLDENLLLSIA